MSYTQQLYQLQQIDSQTDAAKKRLMEINAALVESEALKQARTQLEQAEAAFNKIKAAMTDLDLEVKGLQQKISQHENRLYSGKLSNPKEAASLQDEIASVKRWLAKREEDLLELMIELEDAEASQADCAATLAQTKAQWEADQAELLREQAKKRVEAATLIKSRPDVSQFADPVELKKYEALRKKKRGIGVAAVKNGTCLACGVGMSSRLIQQAVNDNKLYFCDSCGRIIHVI